MGRIHVYKLVRRDITYGNRSTIVKSCSFQALKSAPIGSYTSKNEENRIFLLELRINTDSSFTLPVSSSLGVTERFPQNTKTNVFFLISRQWDRDEFRLHKIQSPTFQVNKQVHPSKFNSSSVCPFMYCKRYVYRNHR